MNIVPELHQASKLIHELANCGIEPTLFGSLGVAIYLERFKEFGDIDLLVSPSWLNEEWQTLQNVLESLGFRLVDEKEHEFQNGDGVRVAFAGLDIFERDGIAFESEVDIVEVEVGGCKVKTFSPELFKRAYEYSVKDGYRTEARGKKDQLVIDLLEDYIKKRGR